MHSNGIRGELAFYFLCFSFDIFSSLFSFSFHLLPLLQEDRYHFVEEMFTHHNDDAAPGQHLVYFSK